ncbi:unnamed protein product [Danaus chrysippus]|uniref:(African queen) hypothetical protein n=1 Tax=Danaus chrysippus TaxID=151541 RepID=A0A8J2QRF6_9NEOP|nr:unnamed protein product [Danaus chrysippus]
MWLQLIAVVFSLNCFSPVLMYYIYDENAMVGFISPTSVGAYGKNRQPVHKKYLVGNNNQKNMKLVNERAVDSHFQISKTSPVSFAAKPNIEKSDTKNIRKDTEPPRQINFKDQKIEIQHKKNQTQPSMKKVDSHKVEQKKVTDLNDQKKRVNDALFKLITNNIWKIETL